ncbi:MAG: asparagine synthase (glutamine-hydrolyzing) [Trebonia sp.]|jgi:asparagine synthase (glutamine-hydrolysing)|uniref:asparagine synthase (glutamine-hydrolyzing) n=1 Tax=Trebonia sp. TaxID=2767075 RepID=UPI003BAFC9AE
MCGITGWVDFGRDLRGEGERAAIEAMTATMICRGPDAGGTWCSAHAAIGHRRLSVIDLAGGAQPMRAPGEDDVVLTFSGEIYNFTELRHELAARGHEFRTRSDTEVLLHGYLEWGADCVRRLNGMFAFGVWDGRRQELLLARDRLGVKPLYYAARQDGVLFGSEPKSVLAHPDFRAEIDAEGLAELFSQVGTGTPGHGVYRGLSQVRPGTLVRAGRDGIRESAYWRLEAREHAGDLASTAGTVRELLADIVHRQTVADVPLCSLLSGGLDSSVVSALAADSLSRRDRAKLATFSVDFTGSADAFTPDQLRPSHDEPFARAAAEYIGSRHSTITLEADDLVTAQWAPLAAHDLPTFGDMYVSFVLLCREISKQSTVALSGEAADEVFGGYPWYHVPALLAAPTFPWAARGSWEPLLRPDVRTRIRLREYAADRYAQALAEVPRLAGESPEDRRIREILYLGLTRWLPFLLDRKDRLSMACGLEVRVPFTDHRLVEYVWNVPWSMKEAGGIEKGLLRAAADGLLPGDLLRRRKSIYPGAADPAYERAIDAQLRRLMTQPDAPLFELISREALTAAYAADPRLPGLMSVQPSSTSPVAFLLDVNRWLERSGVTIR